MHKLIRNILIFIVSAFVILIVWLDLSWARGIHNENETKQLLSIEISNLPIPPSCKESKKTYQNRSVDTNSAWFINYSCSTTIGIAENFIRDGLISRGYTAKDTSSYPDFSRNIYTNKSFYIDYYFIRSIDKNDYQTPYTSESPLQQLSVHIYRTDHTY
jgi:hypothetical protein